MTAVYAMTDASPKMAERQLNTAAENSVIPLHCVKKRTRHVFFYMSMERVSMIYTKFSGYVSEEVGIPSKSK